MGYIVSHVTPLAVALSSVLRKVLQFWFCNWELVGAALLACIRSRSGETCRDLLNMPVKAKGYTQYLS
jgi:hypothetical protein